MRLIPVTALKEDTKIALDILDENAKILLQKGTVVNKDDIKNLKNNKIASVYAVDDYCFNDRFTYTSQPSNILRKVVVLKKVAKMAAQGTATKEILLEAIETVNTIVTVLQDQKVNWKIVYEPRKILSNDFEEKTIYIAMMSALFALKLGFSKREASAICLGALLKDIALVNATTGWADDKNNTQHPLKGYNYLKDQYHLPEDILNIVLHHEEYYDGTGYPNNLKGEAICAGARIISIVDMYYRIKTTTNNYCSTLEIDFIKRMSQLDPNYLDIFLSSVDIYDPDTLVELTNGGIAVVNNTPPLNPFQPEVTVIKSETHFTGEVLNLAKIFDLNIKRIVYYVE
ncbi:MAG: hypothetical protein ATN34_05565 [Epulopiscium sp. Nele67-Bin002]|nr:MAG: hypothetical protein BEN18_02450 [Epulopiscium sp. Nuni2H_MBin001]OON90173.1 MAG: hypothetical protein ATN33_03735 [Epulopiscium sp. Nele67-Bin001]OON91165.1 MAG: hypothetical protein ATN34_05565 [Epulopiscium sp. Nele67-Bin002]